MNQLRAAPGVKLVRSRDRSPQTIEDHWFLGGQPRLPADMEFPRCRDCGAMMTLFFQADLPHTHPWAGRSVAAFLCTTHADGGMAPDAWPLDGAMVDGRLHLPPGYLERYQGRGFRFLVFETEASVLREDYDGPLAFTRLAVTENERPNPMIVLADSRRTFDPDDVYGVRYEEGGDLVFLLRVARGVRFKPRQGAPLQATPFPGLAALLPPKTHYDLFVGGALTLYGTTVGAPLVWAAPGSIR